MGFHDVDRTVTSAVLDLPRISYVTRFVRSSKGQIHNKARLENQAKRELTIILQTSVYESKTYIFSTNI